MTDLTPVQKLQRINSNPNTPDLELTYEDLKLILQNRITPELVINLIKIVSDGNLTADRLLMQSISSIREEQGLLPISIALRMGANPNLYVSVDPVGNIHVLAYTYSKLYSMVSLDLISSVAIQLIFSGSNPFLEAVDPTGGTIKTPHESNVDTDVVTWLDQTYMDPVKPYTDFLRTVYADRDGVDPEVLTTLGIQLDKPDLIKSPVTLDTLLFYHASEVLKTRIDNTSNPEIGLIKSIAYLNLTGYSEFSKLDPKLTYPNMNDLLLRMKQYYQNGMMTSFVQLQSMLEIAIKTGNRLDQYQFDIIESIDSDVATKLKQDYEAPYWKKFCGAESSRDTSVPVEVRYLAYSLGLDYNGTRKSICDSIRQVSIIDPDKYKTAAIRRQISRVSVSAATPIDFIGQPGLDKYQCRNLSVMQRNPYEYQELDMGYYKDRNDVLWCFTSDMFDSLIENGINPYTNEKIPDEFLANLKNKRSIVKRLGFHISDSPVSVSEGVSNLKKNDSISNVDSDKLMVNLNKLLQVNGASVKVEQLNNAEMSLILANIGLGDVNLEGLTLPHAHVTFTRLSLVYLKQYPQNIVEFAKLVSDQHQF